MKFTIRDRLWLTALVAILCGWGLQFAAESFRHGTQNAAYEYEIRTLKEQLEQTRTELAKPPKP